MLLISLLMWEYAAKKIISWQPPDAVPLGSIEVSMLWRLHALWTGPSQQQHGRSTTAGPFLPTTRLLKWVNSALKCPAGLPKTIWDLYYSLGLCLPNPPSFLFPFITVRWISWSQVSFHLLLLPLYSSYSPPPINHLLPWRIWIHTFRWELLVEERGVEYILPPFTISGRNSGRGQILSWPPRCWCWLTDYTLLSWSSPLIKFIPNGLMRESFRSVQIWMVTDLSLSSCLASVVSVK